MSIIVVINIGGLFIFYFIDTKTQKIHLKQCEFLSKKNKFFLGFHNNLESVVITAISEGYINAKICSYCCTSIKW